MNTWATLALGGLLATAPTAAHDDVEAAMARVRELALAPAMVATAAALWNANFDGGIVVYDPASGRGVRWDGHRGRGPEPFALPERQLAANTCLVHAEGRDAMLVLPLPEDAQGLAALLWHERWHCVQDALGLPPREVDTTHLDDEQPRVSLRLELRALGAALQATGDAQRGHVQAALDFRDRRRILAGDTALGNEAVVERNEGLAEYSGRRIAAGGDRDRMRERVVAALAAADRSGSFVRSAAYATGPAYGLLLDAHRPAWRGELQSGDALPALLAAAMGIEARGMEADSRDYDEDRVVAEERGRARERAARANALRASLVEGPALRLPLQAPSIAFDPRSLFPLDDRGVVYTPLTVTDTWGRLEARGGALLSSDWRTVTVPAQPLQGCGQAWQGEGWTLQLVEGWQLQRSDDGAPVLVHGGAPQACGAP